MSHYLKKQRERAEELALVDHPSGLVPWELRFCQEYADKGQIVEAMKQVCAVHELKNDHSLRMRAVALLKRPIVQKYLRTLFARVEEMGVLTKAQGLMILTDIATAPRMTQMDGGEICPNETKLAVEAIKQISKMQGWDAPVKMDVNHSAGVMIVPMAENLTDWEAAAADSQARLMADAIDV